MELDFTASGAVEGAIVFPGYTFSDLPRQSPINEQTELAGSSSTGISITGSIGTSEN